MRNTFFLVITLIFAQSVFAVSGKPRRAPNIVLLFADDAGYADFGFQGSDVMQTPNLDKLAATGVRFSQGYVSDATCGPSRAGLMTGKYQQRFGYEEINVPGYMSENSGLKGADMGLPLDQKTMADYLKERGYKTAVYGKWHLGDADRFHPTNRGFDEFYGFRGGDRSYFKYDKSNPLEKGEASFDKKVEIGMGVYEEPDGYLTDVLAEKAVQFIEKNQNQPFFIYLAFNAVHTPMEALESDMRQFPNLSGTRRELAAMTFAMDRASGKVLDKLKELGLDENTLVVFSNDNGGPSDKNGSSNYPLAGTKSNHLEGGLRVPFLMRWPGILKAGSVYEFPVSTLDLLPTFYEAAGGDKYASPIDGVNLVPYLTGIKSQRPHSTMYWKKETRAVIRDGDWKLIRFPDRPAELYNLADDIGEQHDLAVKQPDKVRGLFKKLFDWELTLERPLWLLKRQYEKYDIDRMDAYRKPEKS